MHDLQLIDEFWFHIDKEIHCFFQLFCDRLVEALTATTNVKKKTCFKGDKLSYESPRKLLFQEATATTFRVTDFFHRF